MAAWPSSSSTGCTTLPPPGITSRGLAAQTPAGEKSKMPLSGCVAGSPSDGHPTGKALLPAFPELAPLPWAESRCGLVTCSCSRRWAPARGPTEACPPVPRGFPGTRGLNPKCLPLRPLSLNSAHPHMPRHIYVDAHCAAAQETGAASPGRHCASLRQCACSAACLHVCCGGCLAQ